MTTTIYYFSATGNTLYIAKLLAERLGADLLPMTTHMNDVCESEQIGFLFPIYFWGLPRTVVTFIENLQITGKNPYLFAVTTCGGIPGGAVGAVNDLLADKNLTLSYGSTIRMVPNFIEEYNPRVKWAEKLDVKAERAAAKAALQIMSGTQGKIPKVRLKDQLFYKLYTNHKLNQDQGFHADSTCTGCGICSKVCPNQNIILKKGKPEFQHGCEHCMACIHWCPQSALQWKTLTQKRNRYHHANVKLKEILAEMERK